MTLYVLQLLSNLDDQT